MTLNEIIAEQKEFQKHFFDPDKLSDEAKVLHSKENILAIHRELGEVLETLNWKTHRKENKIKSRTNTVEEIIDCFKYLMNLCVIWGIDEETFVKEFMRKTNVVKQRYKQEIMESIKPEDKVCAIDLDDTLSNSSEYFTELFNDWHETNFKNKKEIKKTTPLLEYEEFKNNFRESGVKVHIPVKNGAKELCYYLKSQGYKIVIISARPYEKYFRIFPDTMEWLEKNGIIYDELYFEKNKHVKILEQLPQLEFIIEDDLKNSEQVANQNFKVFFLQNEVNKDKEIKNDKIVRVDNLFEIIEHLKK